MTATERPCYICGTVTSDPLARTCERGHPLALLLAAAPVPDTSLPPLVHPQPLVQPGPAPTSHQGGLPPAPDRSDSGLPAASRRETTRPAQPSAAQPVPVLSPANDATEVSHRLPGGPVGDVGRERVCVRCKTPEANAEVTECGICGTLLPAPVGGPAPRPAPPPPDVSSPPAPAARAVPRRLRLRNPDVIIPIPPGPGVVMGRLPPSPLASHPSCNPHISGAHIRVWVDPFDPSIVWVAEASTNGTWLNNQPLLRDVHSVLRVGDTIRLAQQNPVFIEVLG